MNTSDIHKDTQNTQTPTHDAYTKSNTPLYTKDMI